MKKYEITVTANALNLPKNWNNGQIAEALASYTLLGKVKAPDCARGTEKADFADIQCKGYHATIGTGTTEADLIDSVEATACSQFCYVTKDRTALYLMSKAEWLEVVARYHYFTTSSLSGHEGEPTIRLRRAEKNMLKWFATLV